MQSGGHFCTCMFLLIKHSFWPYYIISLKHSACLWNVHSVAIPVMVCCISHKQTHWTNMASCIILALFHNIHFNGTFSPKCLYLVWFFQLISMIPRSCELVVAFKASLQSFYLFDLLRLLSLIKILLLAAMIVNADPVNWFFCGVPLIVYSNWIPRFLSA